MFFQGSVLSRRKREAKESKTPEGKKIPVFTDQRKYKTLVNGLKLSPALCSGDHLFLKMHLTGFNVLFQSCSGDAKCVEIKCPLLNLDSSADIILRSRLWNSTFLEVRAAIFIII